jgi:uncharacterized protein YkwD
MDRVCKNGTETHSMSRFKSFQRVIAIALGIALLAPLSASAESRRLPQTEGTEISAESIVAAMNAERRQRGLGELRLDSRLNAAATDRARDMFAKSYFNHISPDGTQPFVWVKNHHYRYATIGENLADGYRNARAVVDGWMRSPGHRANVLGTSFEDVGLSIVRGSPTRRTNGYTVVALYAHEAAGRGVVIVASR